MNWSERARATREIAGGTERVERDGEACYFTSATGERYRVYDMDRFVVNRIRPLEDRQCFWRVFVSATGERLTYRFQWAEHHTLCTAALDRQLEAAQAASEPATESATD